MPTVNAVYYPSWKVYNGKPPSCLNVQATTHILYAFIRVNEDGSLKLLDEWGDINMEVDGAQGCLGALAKLKQENPNIRTLISVGGGSGSDEFPALAANPDARAVFAQQIREFCDRHAFDGVDIDWEHPTTEDQGWDYLSLLQATREALPGPDYLVTTALPVGEYCLQHIDLEAAGRILDFINLMGYDFVGGWTDVSGHHAQLCLPSDDVDEVHPNLRHCCAGAVDYIISRGFPSSKIVLGVPAYARFFPGASGLGEAFSEAGELDYCDLSEDCVNHAQVDEKAAAACYVDDCDGKGFVTFDVPRTVVLKAQFAKEKALAGLFYWTGVGDREGDHSLVAAGYTELTS
ncbi:unnamed protein product [Clonostachys solani]|uniref:chitinase n=1 Tax=Clonostachys solani TaxID=160281 RepID=A0A9N9W0P2_9HYPO|nr:unnamed protein product [Clonostachys solani]